MYIEDDIDGVDIGKMRHPCIQFNNDERFSFADGPFYSKLAQIDEQFCESQQFESKAQLKITCWISYTTEYETRGTKL
jgi:hypothetical protein